MDWNIILLFAILKLVESQFDSRYYTQFSKSECEEGDIRIEVIEIPNWSGYYLWRDVINSEGGICVGGDTNALVNNECKGGRRMPVCLQIIDLSEYNRAINDYQAILTEWVDDIADRDYKRKPHFIILPMGDEYNIYLNKYIYNKYGMYGFEVGVIGSCGPEEAYSNLYQFSFSPIMKSSEAALPAIELFHKRLHYSRWMILGDTNSIQFSLNTIQAIVDQYRSETGYSMDLLQRRCEGDRSNFTGINCHSVSDCPSEEACIYPLVNTSHIIVKDTVDEIEKWLLLAQELDPDVLILNVDSNLPSYLQILKAIGYTPKVIMSFTRDYTVVQPRKYDLDNTYLYYTSEFNENQNFGDNNIKSYLGSTNNYLDYVKDNYQKYTNSSVYVNIDLDGDYEYVARGSLIGITIQRVVELSSTMRSLPFGNDKEYFESNPVNNIYTTIHNFFSVCENKDNNYYTQPCDSFSCDCKPWTTFFGKVGFDVDGMNNELKSTIVQIQSYDNYKSPIVVSPSSSPACNKNGHICTEENGFSDCSCNFITPSPWTWNPVEKSSYFLNPVVIAFYVICALDMLLLVSLFIFTINNRRYSYYVLLYRKLKAYKFPIMFSFWYFLPLIIITYQFIIVGRPTTFLCSLQSFVYYLAIGTYAFTPYLVNKEVEQNFSYEGNVIYKEAGLLIIYYLFLVCRVFISPIHIQYNSDLIGNRLVYYYSCESYYSPTLFSYFIWFEVAAQIYFFVYGSKKKNKLVVYTEGYYLALGIMCGAVLLVNDWLLPYERFVIVFFFTGLVLFGFCYMLPFPIIIFMRAPPSLLQPFSLSSKKHKIKEMKKFLNNKILRIHMICYAEQINMKNLVEFYHDVKEFSKSKAKEELEQKAYVIITKYIEKDDVKLTQEIKDNITAHFATKEIFKEAKKFVFDKLLNEFWDGFISSSYYEMGLNDVKYFRYIESHSDNILRCCAISLVVNILNNKMSEEEIDGILTAQQRRKTTLYKKSMAFPSSRANSRPVSIVVDNENNLKNVRSGINLLPIPESD